MKNELVSVVIPLYNHERYVEECLDSVLAQDLPNIELLLLDDGSADEGFDVACRWKDRHGHRFTLIHFDRQGNAGITQTLDRLIRRSTGQFILMLASDDVLLPGSILQRLNLFRDDGVMAVFGDAIPIDDSGNVLGKSAIGELGNPSSREALGDPRTLPWELIFRWNIYGSVLLCRRVALLAPDGSSVLNLNIYAEDMQLYYRFGTQGSLRYLDRPVAKYRLHSANTSGLPENVSKLRKNICLKEHAGVDTNHGFVLATELTQASVSDSIYLPYIVAASCHTGEPIDKVYADKGYYGKPNWDFLAMNNIADGIMRKDTTSTKLTDTEIERNKQLSKKRYIVEQYFGISHMHYSAFRARFPRMIKNVLNNLFRQMAFNLFRGNQILGTVKI